MSLLHGRPMDRPSSVASLTTKCVSGPSLRKILVVAAVVVMVLFDSTCFYSLFCSSAMHNPKKLRFNSCILSGVYLSDG